MFNDNCIEGHLVDKSLEGVGFIFLLAHLSPASTVCPIVRLP